MDQDFADRILWFQCMHRIQEQGIVSVWYKLISGSVRSIIVDPGFIHSHDKTLPTKSVRNIFDAANSLARSVSIVELTCSSDPVVFIALREDNIFLVAPILLSVAAIHFCCCLLVELPMYVDIAVLTMLYS